MEIHDVSAHVKWLPGTADLDEGLSIPISSHHRDISRQTAMDVGLVSIGQQLIRYLVSQTLSPHLRVIDITTMAVIGGTRSTQIRFTLYSIRLNQSRVRLD